MEHNSSSKLKGYIKYEYGFPFLDLSGKGLSRVPDAVTELTEVEELKLDNNNLAELPTSINKLKNLVRLHLYSNRLTELPAEIGDLKKLNALYVSSNKLVSLPTSVQTLNQLAVLELDGNKITELPSQVGDLKKLKKLFVYNNQLVGLPTSIQKLNQLQNLNLSNNTLTELPAVIGDLKQLKRLHVSNNQLVSLPTSIQKLNQLEDLQLSRNKLTELPSEIGDLKELRRLDVSYNQLVGLPTSIQKLNQLEELHLYGNKFTELPSEIVDFTEKLKRLNLRYNPLRSDAIHVLEMKKKGSMTSSVVTGESEVFLALEQIKLEASRGKTELLVNLERIALERGLLISDSPGDGNCMFFALSNQLHHIKGIKISDKELRQTVVQYLSDNPRLADGTELFHFVDGYSSWNAYLTTMMADGTWGDHLILHSTANCFKTCIQVVSSLPHRHDVMICPEYDVTGSNRLVLGHVQELHYVSLFPRKRVPSEIVARGPRAQIAYENALKTGEVNVYRARIMLIGQDRAGKTSLKKSFLGLPFDPDEDSTDGIEVDPSKFEVYIDKVKNWKRTDEKLGVSQFASNLARMVAGVIQKDEEDKDKDDDDDEEEEEEEEEEEAKLDQVLDTSKQTELGQGTFGKDEEDAKTGVPTELNIDPTLPPKEFTDHLVELLKGLNLQSDVTSIEHDITLDLWDFAGQHLYYASYPVFLSTRAVYMLVYDLGKKLKETAQPCFRQGTLKLDLTNPNKETNMEHLLSWLVSISYMHLLQPEVNEGKDLPYVCPPVFIVGTHADKPHQDVKEIELQIQGEIVGKDIDCHVIRPFFWVDNTQGSSDEGVIALQKRLIEVLGQQPYMGEERPVRWFNFEKVVQTLVSKGVHYLDLEQLQEIVQKVCFIEEEDEAGTMLDFYHDLGMIVRHRNTIVLQAQWLIEVFKQLITIRSFNDMDPKHSKLWKEMEATGVLKMELVDYVFSKFCEEDRVKEDILNMMEHFGLIVKFAPSPKDKTYFVPCQLKTPPGRICQVEPSPSDPCPLYLRFLGGFVPRGLFCQLVSRLTRWCSESGFKQKPRFFDGASRFFIEKEPFHRLILLCKKRVIKIILKKQKKQDYLEANKATVPEINDVAVAVREFLEEAMQSLIRGLPCWNNLAYDFSIACPECMQEREGCSNHGQVCCTHEDCLCLLSILEGGTPNHCQKSDETPTVPGLKKWFSFKELPEKLMFSDLRKRQREVWEETGKTELSENLKRKALENGLVVSDNQGKGNCMFFALSEQLDHVKGIKLSHSLLRGTIVQYLKDNPALPDGTQLFHFVDGYSSWNTYLTSMMADGTWGDHVILHAAANCFTTCIRVISSLPHHGEVMICPEYDVTGGNRLVLGHEHELHYVSLVPLKRDRASNPPEVTLPLLKTEDLPKTGVPWDDGRLPTDILLLTVEDCEFLGCLSHLNSSFCRSYCKELGWVYFGELGRGEMKIKMAVMKCYKGSITPGGSAVSVSPAVRVLRPKAVFLVGICHSLKSSEVKLGDVAISEKLITCVPSSDEAGDKVPLKSLLLKLIPNAGDGWKAPLKDPKALEVKIHRGDLLSVPGVIDNNECRETLIKRFPHAIAMELEGQGLYAAAHALDVPWIIIKGISDYADCRKSGTDRWRSFASLMAASLTAHVLSDPVVFQDWPHYKETH